MSRRPYPSPIAVPACLLVTALALAGCAQQPESETRRRGFSPSEYGVPASPRVVQPGQPVPRGGGAYRVGRPYVVRGRTYVPREDPSHEEVGVASWYGDDDHVSRTANGEFYDQFAFSAAHPTLPMPSYVRVTNLQNHRSVVVRINDRGPFHSNRVIDLSRRAAQVLEIRGLGRVRVTYFGRGSLDGRDDWLVTTVRQNGRALPAAQVAALAPVPEWARHRPEAGATAMAALRDPIVPTPPERPREQPVEVAGLAPAPRSTGVAQAAPAGDAAAPMALAAIVRPALAASPPTRPPAGPAYVHVGAFRDHAQALRYRESLARHGSVAVEPVAVAGIHFYQVRIGPIPGPAAEAALRDAQSQGASNARLAPVETTGATTQAAVR